MWGEIENKKIKEIRESYCLGEACLIFVYDQAERTVGFKSKQDLKWARAIFEAGTKEFSFTQEKNIVKVSIKTKELSLGLVNSTHASRFIDILENFKK